MSKKRRKNNAS